MSSVESNTIKIIIGGDVCPVRRNEPLFCEGSASEILGNLLPAWTAADFRIVNLECPLISTPSPIRKTGPNLSADERTVNGLNALGIEVVGIANNHIFDHSTEGLLNTIRKCRENGIAVVGGGASLSVAQEPLVSNIKGLRLGIIAMADHEWSIADRETAGANPFTIPSAVRTIRRLNNDCDHLIALLHLGKEHYPYPSPTLQDTCRFLVEEGVSVVVCQHSHCTGAYEFYQNGFISYGQGNFIFDRPEVKQESWSRGYLIEASLEPNKKPAISIYPFAQRRNSYGIDALDEIDCKKFFDQISVMNQEIQNPHILEMKWSDFCREKSALYLSIFSGHGRLRRKINQFTGLLERFYSDEAIAILENVVRCEAHRDVILSTLQSIRKKRWGRNL